MVWVIIVRTSYFWLYFRYLYISVDYDDFSVLHTGFIFLFAEFYDRGQGAARNRGVELVWFHEMVIVNCCNPIIRCLMEKCRECCRGLHMVLNVNRLGEGLRECTPGSVVEDPEGDRGTIEASHNNT